MGRPVARNFFRGDGSEHLLNTLLFEESTYLEESTYMRPQLFGGRGPTLFIMWKEGSELFFRVRIYAMDVIADELPRSDKNRLHKVTKAVWTLSDK